MFADEQSRRDFVKQFAQAWNQMPAYQNERPLALADRMAWQHVREICQLSGRKFVGGWYTLKAGGEVEMALEFGPLPGHGLEA